MALTLTETRNVTVCGEKMKKVLTGNDGFSIISYVATHKRCEARIDAWLSLVERCVRDAEVAGSNPVASTLHFQGFRETETLIFLSSSNFVLTVAVYPFINGFWNRLCGPY